MAETTNDHGPSYYKRGSIDVWDFIRDQKGLGFHLGNVIKYVCRAGYKDNDIEDSGNLEEEKQQNPPNM